MKVGVIGGGNMGCVLATKFSQNNEVCLYTNLVDKAHLYKKDMQVYLEDNNSYYRANIKLITTSLKELCDNSDYIFITFPSFLFKELCKDMLPHLRKGHHLIIVPGSGGGELAFKEVLSKGVTISGLQRVHSVARIEKFGELTRESGIRKLLKVATIPTSENEEICKVVSSLYGLEVERLRSYLNITFVNSNPILHTSRLYTLFKDYKVSKDSYKELPLFYEGWNDETSSLLIKMDQEIFLMIDELNKHGLDIHQLLTILEHYESVDASSLTNKISSIKAFKGLTTPSIKLENGEYIPDLSSRYFTADFTYGLDILLSFAEVIKTPHENIKKVSDWYHKISTDKRIYNLKDYGISSIIDIVNIYK